VSLKRDAHGRYILRFWTNGRGSRLAYHNLGKVTHKEAKDRAKALIAASEESKTLADPNITFKRLSDLWLKLHATPNLRPRAYAGDEAIVRLHLAPAFGPRRVRDLLPVDVERSGRRRWRRLARQRRDDESSAGHLRQILTWGAVKRIVPNPIPPRSVKRLPEMERTVYFEPEEWRAFIAAAEADPSWRSRRPSGGSSS